MMADEDETERLFFLTSRFWTGLELRLSIIRKTHTHTHTHQHDGRWNIHQLKWIIEEGCGLRRWRRQEEMKGWREGSGVSRSLKSLEKSEIDGEGTKLSPSLRYFYFQRFKKKCFLSPQLAFEVLGEHPEEPSLHLRRPRDGGGGRVAARHLSDLHGRLHQIGAQTQQSQYTQIKDRTICF